MTKRKKTSSSSSSSRNNKAENNSLPLLVADTYSIDSGDFLPIHEGHQLHRRGHGGNVFDDDFNSITDDDDTNNSMSRDGDEPGTHDTGGVFEMAWNWYNPNDEDNHDLEQLPHPQGHPQTFDDSQQDDKKMRIVSQRSREETVFFMDDADRDEHNSYKKSGTLQTSSVRRGKATQAGKASKLLSSNSRSTSSSSSNGMKSDYDQEEENEILFYTAKAADRQLLSPSPPATPQQQQQFPSSRQYSSSMSSSSFGKGQHPMSYSHLTLKDNSVTSSLSDPFSHASQDESDINENSPREVHDYRVRRYRSIEEIVNDTNNDADDDHFSTFVQQQNRSAAEESLCSSRRKEREAEDMSEGIDELALQHVVQQYYPSQPQRFVSSSDSSLGSKEYAMQGRSRKTDSGKSDIIHKNSSNSSDDKMGRNIREERGRNQHSFAHPEPDALNPALDFGNSTSFIKNRFKNKTTFKGQAQKQQIGRRATPPRRAETGKRQKDSSVTRKEHQAIPSHDERRIGQCTSLDGAGSSCSNPRKINRLYSRELFEEEDLVQHFELNYSSPSSRQVERTRLPNKSESLWSHSGPNAHCSIHSSTDGADGSGFGSILSTIVSTAAESIQHFIVPDHQQQQNNINATAPIATTGFKERTTTLSSSSWSTSSSSSLSPWDDVENRPIRSRSQRKNWYKLSVNKEERFKRSQHQPLERGENVPHQLPLSSTPTTATTTTTTDKSIGSSHEESTSTGSSRSSIHKIAAKALSCNFDIEDELNNMKPTEWKGMIHAAISMRRPNRPRDNGEPVPNNLWIGGKQEATTFTNRLFRSKSLSPVKQRPVSPHKNVLSAATRIDNILKKNRKLDTSRSLTENDLFKSDHLDDIFGVEMSLMKDHDEKADWSLIRSEGQESEPLQLHQYFHRYEYSGCKDAQAVDDCRDLPEESQACVHVKEQAECKEDGNRSAVVRNDPLLFHPHLDVEDAHNILSGQIMQSLSKNRNVKRHYVQKIAPKHGEAHSLEFDIEAITADMENTTATTRTVPMPVDQVQNESKMHPMDGPRQPRSASPRRWISRLWQQKSNQKQHLQQTREEQKIEQSPKKSRVRKYFGRRRLRSPHAFKQHIRS